MPPFIEVVVSPQGETVVQTKGYVGSECLAASRWLEQALGLTTAERRTTGFYQTEQSAEQHVEQHPPSASHPEGVPLLKRILLEEFHLNLFVPRGLPRREYVAIQRVLQSTRFRARLRRHLHSFCQNYRALKPVQLTVTR